MIKYSSNNKITEKHTRPNNELYYFSKICEALNESFNPLNAFQCILFVN